MPTESAALPEITNSTPNPFPLATLFRYRVVSLGHSFRSARRESRLKITVVTIAGLMFWGGLFWTFMEGIRFVFDNAGPFAKAIIHYGLNFFFLTVMVMLVFSNALISFTNLFKSNETSHLYTMPLRRETIFLYKLAESLFYSSWAVFALGFPLIVALGIRTHAAWPFYPLAALMAVPFVIFPAGLGSLIGLL